MNQIVATYSALAEHYDDERNRRSCWGRSAEEALSSLRLADQHRVVADVGCGTGRALARLARSDSRRRWIGVEPAEKMRILAREMTKTCAHVDILDGSFERLPLASASVDYLYSIHAFHWTTDLVRSVQELARVLGPSGEMDLFFTGRYTGQEFLRKTTPIFLKYMGPTLLLESAGLRKQLTTETARALFASVFPPERVMVEETSRTNYDSLEGHWSWWVRAEGHFAKLPREKKVQCDDEIRRALARLDTEQGIPYTIHLLHVRVTAPGSDGRATAAPRPG